MAGLRKAGPGCVMPGEMDLLTVSIKTRPSHYVPLVMTTISCPARLEDASITLEGGPGRYRSSGNHEFCGTSEVLVASSEVKRETEVLTGQRKRARTFR